MVNRFSRRRVRGTAVGGTPSAATPGRAATSPTVGLGASPTAAGLGGPARASTALAAAQLVGPPVLASPAQAPAALIDAFGPYLSPVANLPDPTVVVLQVGDRTLGVGNVRGLDTAGTWPVVELRGGQLAAVVRFQVWGAAPAAVDTAMTELQGRLLAAGPDLWDVGVLAIDGIAGTLAAQEREAWARTADYQVLFEYHLAPVSAAESLIAAVPIAADQEVLGSTVRETTTVTGDAVRWDEQDAPALSLRGARTVDRLVVAAYLPAATPAPTGRVRVLRTADGATGPPTEFAAVAEFLAAMADPAAARAGGVLSFGSVADFVAAFAAAADGLLLGDWDADGALDDHRLGVLTLDPPLVLPASTDRMEISLETTPFDHVAVVHLRANQSLG